jgi:hypothetical protein
MKHTLTLPDGRTVEHYSSKRYHVISDTRNGLRRIASSDSPTRALSHWRSYDLVKCWLLDGETGEAIRTPDSPRLTGSTR